MPRGSFAGQSPARTTWVTAFGLYLFVVSAYLLSSPGRIDIVDGQIRYEATVNYLALGKLTLRDPVVARFGSRGPDGEMYSRYGPAASIAAAPLVWLGRLSDDARGERRRFLFSLTTAFFGAAIAPLLFFFYLQLGVGRAGAVSWALVSAFASLLWPASTSVFDQAQHAVFLVAALLVAHLAAKRDSRVLATAGGVLAGLTINYQETYVLLIPVIALATLSGSGSRNRRLGRAVAFLVGSSLGPIAWMSFNYTHFGHPLTSAKMLPFSGPHPEAAGNIWVGLTGLLFSPGKSIFLFSPTIVLGVAGFRRLWRREQWLAAVILLATVIHVVFIASFSFWHGDWCWGPRYLVVLLPFWALAFPFVSWSRGRRWITTALVSVGLLVQLAGLSVVHERFFHERGLGAFFWAENSGFYLRQSSLLARFSEIATSLRDGVPETATDFSHAPYRDVVTYFITGFRQPENAVDEMRQFKVFYLPRPWPLWMPRLDADRYDLPVSAPLLTLILLAVGGLGASLTLTSVGSRDIPGAFTTPERDP